MEKKRVNKKVFAQRLKQIMDNKNETIYTVADLVHLSAATISRYTNADMAAKITTIEALARYFGVDPVWLMGYDVPKYPEAAPKKENSFDTIAAHYDGVDLTEEERTEINNYIQYILSKRK
jgi:transcriptional regulator with XRE-family HTH domain